MAGDVEDRLWIVALTARAAFRFEEQQRISITASPASTQSVNGIRLRNHTAWVSDDHTDGAPTFVGGFVAEAAGRYTSVADAVASLGNLASPYFQVVALATNAGVEEPEDVVAYRPPVDPNDNGEFLIQRHSQPRAPAARLRKVHAKDVLAILDLLHDHPREIGIHRAMAHYRMALNQLDRMNRVLPAESLWMAVENLSHVVLDRLRSEHELPQTADGKHQLALKLGFNPKRLDNRSTRRRLGLRLAGVRQNDLRPDRSHLGRLDSYIRKEVIFGGDDECYRELKDASDGFEHGYMDFGLVQAKSKVADRAFAHVRQAILREIGLADSSPLFAERFDGPLGVWRPALEVQGTYTDSSPAPLPTFTPDALNDDWPDPPGLSFVPLMTGVIDNADGTRTVSLQANGSTAGLTETQTAKVHSATWVSPGAADDKILSKQVVAKLNGEVIYDELEIPPEADGTAGDDTTGEQAAS